MENNETVGAVVARFQVAELTAGHKEILDFVLSKGHNTNIIVLGLAPTRATKNNPLDFDSRRRMLEAEYPGKFLILYIKDEPSDESWSEHLDRQLADIAGNRPVTLYGSRDSFCSHYTGKYRTVEYKQKILCSGTEQREAAGREIKSSKDWRYGCIYATQNRYPTSYQTVDCAIFDDADFTWLWMAKKEGEKLLRFVGGFVDPKDNSLEEAAKREALEETGMEVAPVKYVYSTRIDDFRYRGEQDKVMTALFVMQKVFGAPKAQDDIKELHRVKLNSLIESDVIPEHRGLFATLKGWMGLNRGKLDSWIEKENNNDND